MLRNRPLLLFLLILALGLFIEGLKSFREMEPPKSRLSGAFGNFEVTPFRVSERMRQEERRRLMSTTTTTERAAGFRLAGQPKLANQYDSSEGHKVAEGAAKATAQNDKNKKKKKKKSARKGSADSNNAANVEVRKYPETNSNNKNAQAPAIATSAAAQFVAAQTQNEKKLPISYDDWAQLVLGVPNPDNVAKLVEFFKNDMVTGEVFYAITQALIQSSNPKQNELAIYAVRQIHTLKSFEFLTEVLKSEPQGSAIAAKTSSAISEYKTANHVSVLKSVLSTHMSEIQYVQITINLIDDATKTLLEDRTPAADAASVNPATAEQTQSREAQFRQRMNQIFSGFIPLLETVISTYSQNEEIVEPAQAARQRIKNLSAIVVAELGS